MQNLYTCPLVISSGRHPRTLLVYTLCFLCCNMVSCSTVDPKVMIAEASRILMPSSKKASPCQRIQHVSDVFPSSDWASDLFRLECCLLTSRERILIISSEHVEMIGNGKWLSEGNVKERASLIDLPLGETRCSATATMELMNSLWAAQVMTFDKEIKQNQLYKQWHRYSYKCFISAFGKNIFRIWLFLCFYYHHYYCCSYCCFTVDQTR